MAVCINPHCEKPENNPDGTRFCQSCGEPVPDKLINRFKITRVLGQGGFGRTYLAKDTQSLDSACVVKQLTASIAGSQLTRKNDKITDLFQREAEQLKKLGGHTRIPQLIAYFREEQYLYLVQEYIQGEDLEKERKKGVWSEKQVRQLLEEILPVLDFVHRNGLVHRDIKPPNIMRRSISTPVANKGDLVLIDFGVSKDLSSKVKTRMAGTRVGTFGYAPEEQMEVGEAYPASDLYSLGATCFELLSEKKPNALFRDRGYSWTEIYHQHLKNPLSKDFQTVLHRLLQRDYQSRYQSAQEVIKALQPKSQKSTTIKTKKIPVKPVKTASTRRRFIEIAVGTLGLTVFIKALENVFSQSPQNTSESTVSQTPSNPTPKLIEPVETPSTPKPQVSITTEPFEFTTVRVNDRGEEIERSKKKVNQFIENLSNDVTLEMVEVPGGRFIMGSSNREKGSDDDERPQHQVTLKSFFIGKYPVTQAQWQTVANLPKINRELDPYPARFKGNNLPVEQVSWFDAVEFCARLFELTGKGYTLPSEAQWEYACRAGTTTPFYFGKTITSKLANYDGTKTYANEPKGQHRKKTTSVGSFPPNAFGVYDMHGNVWEWCADTWHDSYEEAPTDGSAWTDKNTDNNSKSIRLLRGGSWYLHPIYCRSAYRYDLVPTDDLLSKFGFRVCCGIPRTS